MRTGVSARNGNLALTGSLLDGGFVRFYSGPVPLDSDTPLAGNTMIVQCALAAQACAAPTGGTMNFNTINAGVVAASGTPTFARFFRFDGVTAVSDMDVPDEISLIKDAWSAGEPFLGPSITWSEAVE